MAHRAPGTLTDLVLLVAAAPRWRSAFHQQVVPQYMAMAGRPPILGCAGIGAILKSPAMR